MLTWYDALFYIAFVGQIFLISHYFPSLIARRMRHVLETYPPTEYPKLYPKSPEYYRLGAWAYEKANRIIMYIGIAVLFAVIFLVDHSTFADDGFISEFWPAAYGLLQFMPGMVLELSEFSQLKLMRKANASTVRTANLQPRRLFDYLPPLLVAAVIGAIALSILFDLYINDFRIGGESDVLVRAAVTIGTNLFMGAFAAWILYSRNPNPHQASADRSKQISASLRSFAYVSIALSVYMMVGAADDVFAIDYLDAALMSIYFQVIVFLSLGHLLRCLAVDSLNFDVYKAGNPSAEVRG